METILGDFTLGSDSPMEICRIHKKEFKMPHELELPSTEDGTGYLKSAVINHVDAVKSSHERLIGEAQHILSSAEAERQQILGEARRQAEGIMSLAQTQVQELETEVAQKRREVERELGQKSAEANAQTSAIIERAMSKVHSLVKTAQQSLEEAEVAAKDREVESLGKFAEATVHVGTLLKDAEAHTAMLLEKADNDADEIRLRAETHLTYAYQEAQNIEAAARDRADSIMDQANQHQDRVRDWCDSKIAYTVTTMEQFKSFYFDTTDRLEALYTTGLNAVGQLANANFPEPGDTKMLDFPDTQDNGYISDEFAATTMEPKATPEVVALAKDMGIDLSELENLSDGDLDFTWENPDHLRESAEEDTDGTEYVQIEEAQDVNQSDLLEMEDDSKASNADSLEDTIADADNTTERGDDLIIIEDQEGR